MALNTEDSQSLKGKVRFIANPVELLQPDGHQINIKYIHVIGTVRWEPENGMTFYYGSRNDIPVPGFSLTSLWQHPSGAGRVGNEYFSAAFLTERSGVPKSKRLDDGIFI